VFKDRYEQFKLHVQKHKGKYIFGASVVTVAGITCLVMRGRVPQHISCGIPVAAQGGIPVLGESVALQNVVTGRNNVLNAVSYISANRQGPPSWVVRCLETGDVFTSQKAAAIAMDLPASEISRQLNGVIEHVRGNTFERLCMAA
jgi:hypothetical protein